MPNKPDRPVDRDPIRDLPYYLRVFREYLGRRLYLVFGLTLFATVLETIGLVLLMPLLGLFLSDGAIPGGGVQAAVKDAVARLGLAYEPGWLVVLIASFFVAKGLLQFGALAYTNVLRARLMRELRARLLRAYDEMSYGYYVRRDVGHFVSISNAQVVAAVNAFTALMRLGAQLVMAGAYVLGAFIIAWHFGAMAAVVGVALLLLFRRINTYVRTMSRATAGEQATIAKLLVQSLQSFKYVRATDQSAAVGAHVMASMDRLVDYDLRKNLAASLTQAAREPLAILSMMGLVFAYVAVLDAPLAPVLVALLLFYRAVSVTLQTQVFLQEGLKQIGGVEFVRDELQAQHEHAESDGDVVVPSLAGPIVLDRISLAYEEGGPDVLMDVSLTIEPETSVAFVGESGAGKSTLADVLTLMLKPQCGRVLIDGIPGDRIQLASWRRQIGYVSQETVVFNDSIANNICMWMGEPQSDARLFERIRAAARQAHAESFIEALPYGYNTVIGDRGVRLSGGQRQRLFIARELFREPRLLILDEATSALDSESEWAIQQSIDALKGQITVVMIAHRLSTIRNVDRVFVFDRGRLVEEGPYEELRQRADSRLGRLISMQAV